MSTLPVPVLLPSHRCLIYECAVATEGKQQHFSRAAKPQQSRFKREGVKNMFCSDELNELPRKRRTTIRGQR
jgi:hypothetical protein